MLINLFIYSFFYRKNKKSNRREHDFVNLWKCTIRVAQSVTSIFSSKKLKTNKNTSDRAARALAYTGEPG